jgi:hypothetical protein
MPLLEADYKALVLIKVGDTGTVAEVLDKLWTKHDTKVPIELQYNYVLVEAVEVLLGDNWRQFDASEDGQSGHMSQKFSNLLDLVKRADAEIVRLESSRRAAAVQVGRLTTTAPIASPAFYPDANSPDYAGHPQPGWGTTRP